MENSKVIILGASRYDFVSQRGDHIQGTKVHYVPAEDPEPAENIKGRIPSEANLPYEAFQQIKTLPALYEFEFGFKMQRGKPTAVVKGIKYIKQVNLNG